MSGNLVWFPAVSFYPHAPGLINNMLLAVIAFSLCHASSFTPAIIKVCMKKRRGLSNHSDVVHGERHEEDKDYNAPDDHVGSPH